MDVITGDLLRIVMVQFLKYIYLQNDKDKWYMVKNKSGG